MRKYRFPHLCIQDMYGTEYVTTYASEMELHLELAGFSFAARILFFFSGCKQK